MKNVPYLDISDFNSDGTLKDLVGKGKCVVIMVQANYCGFCTEAKPAYEKIAKNKNKVVFTTICIDGDEDEKEATTFLKKWDPSYRGVPSYYGFDKRGNFKKVHNGGRDEESLMKFANSL
jgi:thiol-disulfide isomerase/thioredoxin